MSQRQVEKPEETPPLFGTWPRWYAIVLIELAVIIVIAYVLTESYR
jgi:hypothetical protein